MNEPDPTGADPRHLARTDVYREIVEALRRALASAAYYNAERKEWFIRDKSLELLPPREREILKYMLTGSMNRSGAPT